MESLPNNKSYLIYLSHEDKKFESKLKKMILDNLKNVEVRTFENRSLIPSDEDISKVNLIIIDLLFEKDKIEKIHNSLVIINHKSSTPYLLINDHKLFDVNKFLFFKNYPDLIFDFINESTLNEFIFINRIKVLLSIPRTLNVQKEKIQSNIWKILDYTNMFVIMLDKDLDIKIVNFHLAKILGYENPDDLIGLNWANFLRPSDKDLIGHVCEEIIVNKNKCYKEFTNDILDKDNKTITVKWFNTLINSEFNCVFSIGLPLTKEPTLDEDIDSLRSYFRDILEKDKTTINAMKEVTMKYSEKLFGENKNIESQVTNV